MDEMIEPKNIIIVCLDEEFGQKIAAALAGFLDMFVANSKDQIEYDLIDSKAILDVCGVEYLKAREEGVIKNLADYENTVISFNYDLYHANFEFFKRSIRIYLKLDKSELGNKESMNKIAYSSHDKFLQAHCDVVIKAKKRDEKQIIENIVQKLGEKL